MRVAKIHDPALVYELQQDKARGLAAPDPGADTDLMAPGRMWEESGEFSKAIDAYLKVTARDTHDHDLLEEVWEKAVGE